MNREHEWWIVESKEFERKRPFDRQGPREVARTKSRLRLARTNVSDPSDNNGQPPLVQIHPLPSSPCPTPSLVDCLRDISWIKKGQLRRNIPSLFLICDLAWIVSWIAWIHTLIWNDDYSWHGIIRSLHRNRRVEWIWNTVMKTHVERNDCTLYNRAYSPKLFPISFQ